MTDIHRKPDRPPRNDLTQPMARVAPRRVPRVAEPTVPIKHVLPRPPSAPTATAPPRSPAVAAALDLLTRAGTGRWYRPAIALLALLFQLILYTNSGYSWHYFADAASLFLGQHPPGDTLPGGLHLYANYPLFQFGPVALLATIAVRPFTSDGGWMIVVYMMTLCGLAVLYLLELLVRMLRPDIDDQPVAKLITMLVGGASFVLSWELLAVRFGHMDDVLALTMLAAAAVMVAGQDATLAGVCVGLAIDSKPWALACIFLLLGLPGRARWKALIVAGITVAVAWAPFMLTDPHSFTAAAKFTIPNVPESALQALGVHTATTPSWDRMAQISLGCALGAVAVIRRRWAAVIALGIGARLLLDPSVYAYYTAGLALGLLLWDLTGYARPMPLLSLLCLFGITLAAFFVKYPPLQGEMRLWTVLISTGVILAVPSVDVPDSPIVDPPERRRLVDVDPVASGVRRLRARRPVGSPQLEREWHDRRDHDDPDRR